VVPVGVQGRAGVYFEWFLSGNNEQIEWEEKITYQIMYFSELHINIVLSNI
jgi:hypothetical protein